MKFVVTTPVYNGKPFIDETILSVITQAGPFHIRYHVQDGGSTDGTLQILEAWQKRLADGFPVLCEGLEFTYSSSSDSGVYDAVNRGFVACGDGDVMTWINADDRIEAGCFVSVYQILLRFKTIKWLCGRGALMDEAGSLMTERPVIPFSRSAILARIFDGRFNESFIMQEGSFWTMDLWRSAGPLDATFKLAGDFDLWTRFAKQTDLVVVNSIFGYFRSRKGQLSAQIEKYWGEIDKDLSIDQIKARRTVSRLYMFGPISFRVVTRKYKEDWILEAIRGFKIGKKVIFKSVNKE